MLIANHCIARVKPQGRKNVDIHIIKVGSFQSHQNHMLEVRILGIDTTNDPIFGEMFVKLIQSNIMIIHMINVVIHKNELEKCKKDQNNHNNPHKSQKDMIRHK